MTLEALADGIADASLLQVYENRMRSENERSPGWVALQRGKVQRADGVVHLIGETLQDISADLALLSRSTQLSAALRPSADAATGSPDPRGRESLHRHPRNVRILPRSRDFH